MLVTQTPASLLERLRQPFSSTAWSRFVALYTPMVYAWAKRVGLREDEAGDLVQDVFVILLHVLPTFNYDRHRSFRGWLQTVTLNTWRNARKRASNRVFQGPGIDADQLPGAADLEAMWDAEYRRHLVSRALTVMQSDFQETTWRACWETVAEGRSTAEVAAELGMTVGAVQAAKFRVLTRLREELDGLLE